LAPYFPHARKGQKKTQAGKAGKQENGVAVKQENENCSQMFIPLVNLKNFEHLALAANKSLLFHPELLGFFSPISLFFLLKTRKLLRSTSRWEYILSAVGS